MRKKICLIGTIILVVVIAFCVIFAVVKRKKPRDRLEDNERIIDEEIMENTMKDKPVVEDAVSYSKPITVDPELGEGWYTEDATHDIRLPKITVEKDNAAILNQKMYDVFVEEYEALLEDEEGIALYYSDYEYRNYEGIIGIAICTSIGYQGMSYQDNFNCFYYDSVEDEELTFEEYLARIGIGKNKIWEQVQSSTEYMEFYGESYFSELQYYEERYLKEVILDKDSAVVFINEPEVMMGWIKLDITLPSLGWATELSE